jgi:hypothetical protein
MKNVYSAFALNELIAEEAERTAELDVLIALHAKLSARLDATANNLLMARHEISIRRMARQRWNGATTKIEIVS